MDQSQTKLMAIHAVNSLKSGQIVTLDVDKSTVIQGVNGAGKTSLLRYVLLFFGTAPNEIRKMAGNKESYFSQYHLPLTSSYIAFSYLKEDMPSMVVIRQKEDSNNEEYFFIDSGFEARLFVDEDANFISRSDFSQSLFMKDIAFEGPFSHTVYQDIIQSGINKRSGRGDQKINRAKQRFSLCAKGQRLERIDQVAQAILKSQASFDSLTYLVAQGVLSQLGHNGLDMSNFNSSDVLALSESQELLKAAIALDAQNTIVEQLKEQAILFQDANHQIRELDKELYISYQGAQFQSIQQSQLIQQAEIALDTLNQQYDTQASQQKNIISDVMPKIEHTESLLDQLEQQRCDFDKENIEEKQQKINMLPALDGELRKLEHEKEKLDEGYESTIKDFKLKEHELKSWLLENQRQIEKNNDQKKQLIDDELINCHQRERDELIELNKRHDSQKHDFVLRLKTKDGVIENKKTQLQSPFSEALEAIRLRAEQLGEDYEAAENVNKKSQTQRVELETKLGQLNKQFENIDSSLRRTNEEIDGARRDKAAYEKELASFTSSVYHFIKEQHGAHLDQALRVLSADALRFKVDYIDFDDNSHQGLMNLKFNYHALAATQIKEESELADAIKQTTQRIKNKEQEASDLKQRLEQTGKELKIKQKILNDLDAELRKGQNELDRIRELRRNLKQEERDEIEQIRHSLKLSIETHELEQSKLKEVADRNQRDQDQQCYQLLERFREEVAQLSQALEHTKMQKQKQLEQINHQYNQELRQIEDNQSQVLADKGFNVEYNHQLQTKISAIKNEIVTLKDYAERVQAYRYWVKEQFSKKSDYQAKIFELKQTLQESRGALENINREFEQKLYHQNELLKQLNAQLKRLNSDVNKYQLLRTQIDSDNICVYECLEDTLANQLLNAKEAESRLKLLIEQRQLSTKAGKEAYIQLKRSLGLHQVLRNKVEQGYPHLFIDLDYWHRDMDALQDLFDSFLKNLIESTQSLFRTQAKAIIDLDEKFKALVFAIKNMGNALSKQMDDMGARFSNIAHVGARVEEMITDLPYRKRLALVAEQARAVQSMPLEQYPGNNYFESVSGICQEIVASSKKIKSIEQLIQIKIELTNEDDNRVHIARNGEELKSISSEGLSFLILITTYLALKRTMQKNENLYVHWPIDELGRLHTENIAELFPILDREKVIFVCALPEAPPEILQYFSNIYSITKGKKLRRFMNTTKTVLDYFDQIHDQKGV
ncbi:ATP-binding protein [Thiomicrospira microaerophila]|uniref:ATP-binding protein n=1 Tax=Thiomicrospira microaerophila TaxID=406020 RepID=UPI0005C879F4|nr:ATP-binding protein [Thiomicrospira microaerophila]